MKRFQQFLFLVAGVLCAGMMLGPSQANAFDFPRVKGLEPAVAFWKKVYAVWSVNDIALHDDQDFSIIYRVVRVPKRGKKIEGKTRSQTIKQAKLEVLAALKKFAKKKPKSENTLVGVEKEVYESLKKVTRKDKYLRAKHLRAQNGLRERFRFGWTHAGAFEKEVRRQLKAAGHPEELVALAYVESLMSLKVKSYAGAQGIWQFMPATGREYMNINEVLDERHDPILATVAAGKYLNTSRRRVGPWPVAITSYNYGRAGMRRLIKQVGSKDLAVILKKGRSKRFGFAARNYYASFLAVTEVLKSPTSFFRGAKQVPAWTYDIVRLPFAIKATQLTRKGAVKAKDLKRMNPAIRNKVRQRGSHTLPEGLPLRIPKGSTSVFLSKLKGTKVKKRKVAKTKHHRVRRGESLTSVAKRFKVTRTALAQTNGISRNAGLQVGQRLRIPSPRTRYSLFPNAKNLAVPTVSHESVLVKAEPVSTPVDDKLLKRAVGNNVKTAKPSAKVASKESRRKHRQKARRNKKSTRNVERVKVTLVSAVSWMPAHKLPVVDAIVGTPSLPPIDVLSAAGALPILEPLHEDSSVLPVPTS